MQKKFKGLDLVHCACAVHMQFICNCVVHPDGWIWGAYWVFFNLPSVLRKFPLTCSWVTWRILSKLTIRVC